MDYALPRATDIPPIAFHSKPMPAAVNDIGTKGGGEAGTVGALTARRKTSRDAADPGPDLELDPEGLREE